MSIGSGLSLKAGRHEEFQEEFEGNLTTFKMEASKQEVRAAQAESDCRAANLENRKLRQMVETLNLRISDSEIEANQARADAEANSRALGAATVENERLRAELEWSAAQSAEVGTQNEVLKAELDVAEAYNSRLHAQVEGLNQRCSASDLLINKLKSENADSEETIAGLRCDLGDCLVATYSSLKARISADYPELNLDKYQPEDEL